MSSKRTKQISRRDFLKKAGGTAVLGAGCLMLGSSEVLAAAKAAAKPVLTGRTLSAAIPSSGGALRQVAAEAKRDLKGFIRQRFTLTPLQEQHLESLTPRQASQIHRALDTAVAKGGRLEVRMSQEAGGSAPSPAAPGVDGGMTVETDTTHYHGVVVVIIVIKCYKAA